MSIFQRSEVFSYHNKHMQKEIGCIPESTISKQEKSHKIDVNPFKSIVNNINKDKIENRTRVTHAHGDHVTTYRSLKRTRHAELLAYIPKFWTVFWLVDAAQMNPIGQIPDNIGWLVGVVGVTVTERSKIFWQTKTVDVKICADG